MEANEIPVVRGEDEVEMSLASFGTKNLQLLIVILPEKYGFYDMIKKRCETIYNLVSQCVRPETVLNYRDEHLRYIALKINVKIGGTNSVLGDKDGVRNQLLNTTMIFGADVTHHDAEVNESIVDVVGSMDWPSIAKYRGLVSIQPPRQEIIQDLNQMIRELLETRCNLNNNEKPENILYLRDGIGEGQFVELVSRKLGEITDTCLDVGGDNYKLGVTFILVQKEHKTRLFSVDDEDNSNVLPRTVVDSHICSPSGFDIFLCSHSVVEGTSRPLYYHVLFDENNFTTVGIQSLINNLCHTHARCSHPVSLVPPVFYAHLYAKRAEHALM